MVVTLRGVVRSGVVTEWCIITERRDIACRNWTGNNVGA